MLWWAIGEFGRAATCTNLSTRKSIHIFVISRPNYIGPDKKIEMKFQNKIFYKFIFPQEFPYALVGYRGVCRGNFAQTFPPKIQFIFS
jgi:hypothetical protein